MHIRIKSVGIEAYQESLQGYFDFSPSTEVGSQELWEEESGILVGLIKICTFFGSRSVHFVPGKNSFRGASLGMTFSFVQRALRAS